MNSALQALFDQMCATAKNDKLASQPIIGLGDLIAALRVQSKNATVMVQWGDRLEGYGPVSSYRGYYSDLAIDYGSEPMLVHQVLDDLRGAVGKTFTGYKGGDYTMNQGTYVWVSQHGDNSGVGVTGVKEVDGVVIITSELVD